MVKYRIKIKQPKKHQLRKGEEWISYGYLDKHGHLKPHYFSSRYKAEKIKKKLVGEKTKIVKVGK